MRKHSIICNKCGIEEALLPDDKMNDPITSNSFFWFKLPVGWANKKNIGDLCPKCIEAFKKVEEEWFKGKSS